MLSCQYETSQKQYLPNTPLPTLITKAIREKHHLYSTFLCVFVSINDKIELKPDTYFSIFVLNTKTIANVDNGL